MQSKVENHIRQKDLLHRGATVLLGVSGGPDSMALLYLFKELQEKWDLHLVVLTIDHGLRGSESKEDSSYVEAMCKKWKIQCIETFLDVPSYKHKKQIGTQLAAREMRYAFFEKKMEELQADYLALGHHADDQTETILMRMTRSTNPSALKGMMEKRRFGTGFLIRPLLGVTKQEIEEYLEDNKINPRRDPSNLEDAYTRNYFRLHVIPHLEKKNPNLNHTLQRLSRNVVEDDHYLREQAEKLVEEAVIFKKNPSAAVVNIDVFSSFPFALQRRAFHLILSYLYQDIPESIDYIHEDKFFDLLCSQNPNASLDFPAGLLLTKAYQKLILQFSQPQSAPFCYQLETPGQLVLPDGTIICASIEHSLAKESKDTIFLYADGVSLPLYVRTRKPGDRMSIKGLQGSKKLKDIFIDEKVPKQEREKWPVVTDACDRIVWLAGLKKGAVEVNKESGIFIKLHVDKKEYF